MESRVTCYFGKLLGEDVLREKEGYDVKKNLSKSI